MKLQALAAFTRPFGWWMASTLMVMCSGACATYSEKTSALRNYTAVGDSQGALTQVNGMLKVNQPEALPSEWERDTPLLVLERATLLQYTGVHRASAINFSAADKELDFLDLSKDAIGKIGQYVYSDTATKYKTTPTEKLTLNALNLINYLVLSDLSGARIEARRMTVMQKYLADALPDRHYGTFGSYLAGFAFEKLGEVESAIRYYDEALMQAETASAQAAVARLAARTSYRTERLTAAIASQAAQASVQPTAEQEQWGDVLVLITLGRAPFKVAHRMPIGAAVALAHGFFTGDPSLIGLLGTKFINFPEMVDSGSRMQQAQVRIDGQAVPVEQLEDLRENVLAQHQVLKPRIIGSAITRLISRALAAEGARAAGRAAGGGGSGGSLIGLVAALAVEGTMVALDRPDTRSWTMMPRFVLVARHLLPAGPHRVEIAPLGADGASPHFVTREIEVKSGGFVVVEFSDAR